MCREPEAIGSTVTTIPVGRKVRVLAGPFKDLEGVVRKEGREDCLVVYFESIMQGVEITILPEMLLPINQFSSSARSGVPHKMESHDVEAAVRHLVRP